MTRLPNPKRIEESKIGYIHNVFVEPQFRSRGIATALLTEVISICKKEGILKFTLHDTEQSAEIYRRLGFTKVENYYELWIKPSNPVRDLESCEIRSSIGWFII